MIGPNSQIRGASVFPCAVDSIFFLLGSTLPLSFIAGPRILSFNNVGVVRHRQCRQRVAICNEIISRHIVGIEQGSGEHADVVGRLRLRREETHCAIDVVELHRGERSDVADR